MSPASIPQDVVDAVSQAPIYLPSEQDVRVIVAAALTALMDDEYVWVQDDVGERAVDVTVRPSDVLRAVLAR